MLIAALLMFSAAVLSHGAAAGRAARVARFSGGAVSDAALRRRLLPGRLVDLRLGLFALSAARRRRERLVLVDLSRRLHRRLVDDAGRHGGGGAASEAGVRRGAARRGGRGAAGLRQAAPAVLAARAGDHHDAQFLRRLAHAAERRRLAEAAAASRSRKRVLTLVDIDARRDRHRARIDGEFRGKIRRIPRGPPVSVHALDGDQSGGFLLGAPRPLLGARDFQSARHVRALELARPVGIRRRLRRDGAVLQRTGLYVGPVAAALGGADVAMLVGLPVATAVYLWACRSLDVEADRRRAAAADVGLDPDAT